MRLKVNKLLSIEFTTGAIVPTVKMGLFPLDSVPGWSRYWGFISLLGCLLLSFQPQAIADPPKYYYDYTPNCSQAYKAYLALRPNEGDAFIRKEIIAHPYNLMAIYMGDYGDFLTLVFNGDPYERTQRSDHETSRLELLDKAGDEDPWKRLTLAGINMHWAIVHIRFGERFKAAMAFRRSYILLKENARRFPKFAPNSILYGIEEAMAGTIPGGYKWLTNILGLKGDLSSGMARLSNYLRANPSAANPLQEEARIYDYYVRFYLGGAKTEVWQEAGNDAGFDIRNNLFRAFIRANLALSFRKADAAIAAMQMAKSIPGADDYPVLDYELGSALLLKLNPDCTTYLERFASRNKGKLFTKDALQKAALAWYIKGNTTKANSCKMAISQQGSLVTDADIQAQRFSKEGRWPQPVLFQAKMLIDGGYWNQALTILHNTSAAAFSELADQLQYHFSLGRALEEGGDNKQAVQFYQLVINKGQNRSEDLAARAALQMGGIYEHGKQIPEAKRYYELCLSMRDHDFQNAIDQAAKAGLARL